MLAQAVPNRMTPEEYFAAEDGAELPSEYHYGELFAMSGGSANHARIIANLTYLLYGALLDRPCQLFSAGLRVEVEENGRYLYPDIVVACPPDFDDHSNLRNPSLIVEVLSPSTEAFDRGKKFQLFRQLPSLKDYVLVSQDDAIVEMFSKNENGEWMLTTIKGIEARINFASLKVSLDLAGIYRSVELNPWVPVSPAGPGEDTGHG